MKRKQLLKIMSVSAIALLAVTQAKAQEPTKENIAVNLGGTRFVITEPAAIVGIKKINYANWGSAASPTITGAEIEKAYDTLGANPLLNGSGGYPALTGKFALIFRGGGISFSQKVNYCITAGAVGVIIVNNVPGDPVGMSPTPAGSTVSVPVLMVSDVDGQAISDQIKAGTPVKLTLGTWNTGGTHDLGVLTNYQATPHALNIPFHQLSGSTGTEAYKHYIGGAVANYGSSTESSVKVIDSVFWTPTSGSASYVTNNSYTIPSLSVPDSIRFGFGSGTYELAPPTSTGVYEHRYSIDYSATDDFPQDNKGSMMQYVNDSIFCKGRYDYTNARPYTSLSIRPGVTPPVNFIMGNLFYVKNGGYAASKVQFLLSHDNTTNPLLSASAPGVYAYVSKWVDGSGSDLDSIVQAGELSPLGIAARVFSTEDSSGTTFTLDIVDYFDPTSEKAVILDEGWYYVAVEVPTPLFLGVDESFSYFTRSYAQFKNEGSIPGKFIYETPTALATEDFTTFTGNPDNFAVPFPFSGNAIRIDSAFYDRFNEISSVALLMSKTKPSSIKTSAKSIGNFNVYPNPVSTGSLTVNIALDQKSDKVMYKIIDLVGRSVYTELHENVQHETFTINTSGIAPGNYLLTVVTDKGIEARKLTIQKP